MNEHKRKGSLATYDLLDALERNPLLIQAGADICGEAARTIKELEAKLAKVSELLERVFNQGFGEDMNDVTAMQSGEKTWYDSRSGKRLEELKGDKE